MENQTSQSSLPYKLLAAVIVVVIGFAVALIALQNINRNNGSNSAEPGAFPLSQTLQFKGKQVEAKSLLTGDKNIFVFWAMWCGPCVEELTNFSATRKDLTAKGYNFVFVNYDGEEQINLAEKFSKKYNFETSYDLSGQMLFTMGVQTLPTSIIVDKSGKILNVIQGDLSQAPL